MGLMAKKGSNESQFEILDEGTYAAVCTWVVDIGPQEETWNGETRYKRKLKLRFEVPAERVTWKDKDGQEHEGPKVIWATVTNSLADNAKLRQWLESWRGKGFTDAEFEGFDLSTLLDKPCMISVMHREWMSKTYANIANISKLMKGLNPQREGNLIAFDSEFHSDAEFAALPEWLQILVAAGVKNAKALGEAPAYPEDRAAASASDNLPDDEDIPF